MLLTSILFHHVWFLTICILDLLIYCKFESIIIFFFFKKYIKKAIRKSKKTKYFDSFYSAKSLKNSIINHKNIKNKQA